MTRRPAGTGGADDETPAETDKARKADRARLDRFYRMRSAISRAITHITDRPLLLETVCRESLIDGLVVMAWIGFANHDGDVIPAAVAGAEDGYLSEVSISRRGTDPSGAGPVGRAIRFGAPAIVPDIARDARMTPWQAAALRHSYRSCAAFPISSHGETNGALTVYSSEVDTFDEETVALLNGIAEDVSFALDAADTARQRDEAERAGRRAEERFRASVEVLLEGFGLCRAVRDGAGRIVNFRIDYANPAACAIYNLPREELVGRNLLDLQPEDIDSGLFDALCRVVDEGQPLRWNSLRYEAGHRRRADRAVIVDLRASRFGDGFVASFADVTERDETIEALARSEERWRAMVQHSSDVICVLNRDVTIRYISPAVTRVLGHDPEDLIGRPALELVAEADTAMVSSVIADVISGTAPEGPLELRMNHRDGGHRWIELIGTNLLDQPAIEGFVVNARDVTDRHIFEIQLEHQALHDPLTDLPNRALLLDRLDQALHRASESGQKVGVLFLDIDRFKLLNDSRGHQAGDEGLVAVAGQISKALRGTDTVARFGGDEFVVICDPVNSEEELIGIADRIRAGVEGPTELSGGRIHISLSIGLALSDVRDPDQLLSAADAAMYRAKELGRARTELFAAEMRESAASRLALESDLRSAVRHSALGVAYQPVVDLTTGNVLGFEALARWNRSGRGPVGPDQFIPLAEETGLIIDLGYQVLAIACRQLGRWQRRLDAELYMAVNLSPVQLLDENLLGRVRSYADENRLAPSSLMLEVTETALMDNLDMAVEVLTRLKEVPVRLAIDDFGTGYSSLGYLKRLPLDVLKIDRTFVDGVALDDHDSAIATSVVLLAEALGLKAVAEGVENNRQLRYLQQLHCPAGQGYLFSEPLGAEQVDQRWPELNAMPVSGSPGDS